MASPNTGLILIGSTLIMLLSAVAIAYHAAWALLIALRERSSRKARELIARGVLAGLALSMAGTLMKAIALQSWPEIRSFTFIFLLRTLLKRVFLREQQAAARLA